MWKFCSCFILYHSLSVLASRAVPVKIEEDQLPYYLRAASVLTSAVSVFAVHLHTEIINKQLAGMCDDFCGYDAVWGKVQGDSFARLKEPKIAANIFADPPDKIRTVCVIDFFCKGARAYRLTDKNMVDFKICDFQNLLALHSGQLVDWPVMVRWATRVNNYIAGKDGYFDINKKMEMVTEEQLPAYMTIAFELNSFVSRLLGDSRQDKAYSMQMIRGTCLSFCSYQHYWARLETKDPEVRNKLKVPKIAIQILQNPPKVIEELCDYDFICKGTGIYPKTDNVPVDYEVGDFGADLRVVTNGQYEQSIDTIEAWKKRMNTIYFEEAEKRAKVAKGEEPQTDLVAELEGNHVIISEMKNATSFLKKRVSVLEEEVSLLTQKVSSLLGE